jgi:hypothetical protein
MKVTSSSFFNTQIPFVIKIKNQAPKNKIFKTHILRGYLTLFIMSFLLPQNVEKL